MTTDNTNRVDQLEGEALRGIVLAEAVNGVAGNLFHNGLDNWANKLFRALETYGYDPDAVYDRDSKSSGDDWHLGFVTGTAASENSRDDLAGEVDRLRTLLGSHVDGQHCTCTLVRPATHLEPGEWEQDPMCVTHPDMTFILNRMETAERLLRKVTVELWADDTDGSWWVGYADMWPDEASKVPATPTEVAYLRELTGLQEDERP